VQNVVTGLFILLLLGGGVALFVSGVIVSGVIA